MTTRQACGVPSPGRQRTGAHITCRYVAGVAFVASAGGFLFGYDLVIIAGALPFLTREFALSPALVPAGRPAAQFSGRFWDRCSGCGLRMRLAAGAR